MSIEKVSDIMGIVYRCVRTQAYIMCYICLTSTNLYLSSSMLEKQKGGDDAYHMSHIPLVGCLICEGAFL